MRFDPDERGHDEETPTNPPDTEEPKLERGSGRYV